MSEFIKLSKKYPNIAFNDVPNKRNKDHSLLVIEPIVILPEVYNDINIMKSYNKVFTWSSILYNELKVYDVDVIKIDFPIFDNYSSLDNNIDFDDRKDLSLICRYRNPNNLHEHDITAMRYDIFNAIEVETKECFGRVPYLHDYYKGTIGNTPQETSPSSNAKLNKMNEFKFNLCFENCYHDVYSFDYITEKITDCFKSKTIAIYLGCFNIEKYIPKDIFIDFREYKGNINKLDKYLKEMSKNQFENMTEKAYEFINNKFKDYGKIELLEGILKDNV